MLRFLRKYSSSTGVKILYGVLAALFVVWGVGAVGDERVEVVAEVYGRPIARREVQRTTALLQRRYEETMRDRFSPDVARALDFPQRALDQLVEDALLEHEAERLGVVVTDAELIDHITRMPELQDDGRFNRDRLEAFLRAQRDRGEFESEIRRALVFEHLQALVVDGVGVTDGEVEERYRLDEERVTLAVVRLAAADLEKEIALSDEDLERHLAAHADRYQVPTTVRARHAAYRPADFADRVQVTDGEVAEYYELNKEERFTEPEQVRARHILVEVEAGASDERKAAARKKAEDLLAKVKAGRDFAALARTSSDDPGSAAQGGDLGLFAHGRMTPAFESAAFALAPGGVSDVVETPFGFHIIKVEEHRPGGLKPLESVRDEILRLLRDARGLDLARAQAEADRRAVVGGKSLAEAVGTRTLVETPPFAAGADVPGVGRVPEFSEAAFGLGEHEVSDLVETEAAVYLLSPFARVEAHTPPLAEVREQVVAAARRERAEALARERAEALLARARAVGLDEAAREAGASVEETDRFTRRGVAIPKLGVAPELRAEVFTLTPEARLATRVYSVGGDAVVAALRTREPADMAGFAAAKDGLRDSLLQQKRAAVVGDYMNYLKQRAQRDGALEVRADALQTG
jgi:peptidyl-prolyl cis-trans isomerase D